MSLESQLAQRRAWAAAHLPATAQAAMLRATTELRASGILERALSAGRLVPRFTLPDTQGHAVSLDALLARGPVVLSFYRGAWCTYCDMQLRALQSVLPVIRELGGELVAVSPERALLGEEMVQISELAFPVLTDADNAIARLFGLVFAVPPGLRTVYREVLGIDLAYSQGNDRWALPLPATYVIAADGRIAWAWLEADYTRRAEPGEVLAALRRLSVATLR